MANYNQPMFQQALQRQGAKASMRGQRPRKEALLSRLVQSDLARKHQFAQLGLSKKRADLSHKGRRFEQKQYKNRLDEERDQLPWELGIGAGTSLFSALEGNRRAAEIRQAEARKELRHKELMKQQAGSAAELKSILMPMSPLVGKFSGYGI